MAKKINKEEFIQKAKKSHGDKYDYSKIFFKNIKEKIIIICPKHGHFEQRGDSHLTGNGCRKCALENLKNNNNGLKFIEKSKKIHGDRYDYSLVEYKKHNEKIKIICKEHGVFEQKPYYHASGYNCPKCFKLSTKDFIEKSKKIHKNKYDYTKTIYNGLEKKLTITCTEHGEFEQIASNHLAGKGCKKCSGKGLNNIEIINKFKSIHGNKYDYSLVDYEKINKKVRIICSKHGAFEQTPHGHLCGKGCQECSKNKKKQKID